MSIYGERVGYFRNHLTPKAWLRAGWGLRRRTGRLYQPPRRSMKRFRIRTHYPPTRRDPWDKVVSVRQPRRPHAVLQRRQGMLGDGIRRNLATVSKEERDLLLDAIKQLNQVFYPGAR